MIIKKLASALVLCSVILSLITLSGCHGKLADQNDNFQDNTEYPEQTKLKLPAEFDTSKQYTITFWAKNENNETQRSIYRQIVENFEALYPNIDIVLVNHTDYKDIYNKVVTNIPTQTTPNVCITYPDHIATYMQGEGVVVPLDSLIDDEVWGLGSSTLRFNAPTKNEIIPEFLEEGKIGGVQYALPFMRSTEACYVNKTLIEELGFTLPETLTWDFVWNVSEYAMSLGKDANGNYIANGKNVLIPFIYKSTDNMMISMLKQLNAPYSTEAGEIQIFNKTTESILKEIGAHAKSKAFSTFQISSYPGNYLNAGECIFAIDSTAGATWMGVNAPLQDIPEENKSHFETVVMAIPQYDTENPKMISQGPSLCIFNKDDPQEVLASWLFSQFLLTNEVQIAYSQTEGYIPVTSKAQESTEYQDYLSRAGEDNELYYDIKIKASQLLLDNIENSFTTPVFNGSASLRSAAGELIEITTDSARNKNRAIDESFIELLFSRVTSLYKLDQYGGALEVKTELGKLPTESMILISALIVVWLGISVYFCCDIIKRKKK
ncbi:MAG: extracellular solute-binding protein [Ruminococcaceae bacterium]|nr:extracellular solute-binding protein [Oscillospiraceae bacterium]